MKYILPLLLFISQTFAFEHDLHLTLTPGKSQEIMITAHGMGDNYRIAERVPSDKTLVSFNFPDHDLYKRGLTFSQTTLGTPQEILPLLYVIKKCVLEDGCEKIDLYGFSAGGGAIINSLVALHTTIHDEKLLEIGISKEHKIQMLSAIEKGLIILDTPLKSMDEIYAFKQTPDILAACQRYRDNHMTPIEALQLLDGLKLNIVVHFQLPDEVLSNSDDQLFFSRLKAVNPNGDNTLIIGTDQGHRTPHPTLWSRINS